MPTRQTWSLGLDKVTSKKVSFSFGFLSVLSPMAIAPTVVDLAWTSAWICLELSGLRRCSNRTHNGVPSYSGFDLVCGEGSDSHYHIRRRA